MASSFSKLLLFGCALTVAATPAHPPHEPLALRARHATSCSTIQASHTGASPSGVATVSVGSLLDKAIAAMGGKEAITDLKGVRSHA